MKYDTNATGWATILVDYAANVFDKFIDEHEYNSTDVFEMNTRQAFEYELEQLKKQDRTISRASIIFEMNKMVDMGILTYRSKTGKGGHHKVYRLAKSPHELEVDVVVLLLKRIKETWPGAFQEGLQVVQ